MTRVFIAAAALAILVPGTALAQGETNAFYTELRGGAAILTDADIDDDGGVLAASGLDVEIESEIGYLAELAFGYAHDSGFRFEVAGGFRRSEFDEITVKGGGSSASVDLEGDISAYTAMANLYYDFYARHWGWAGMGSGSWRPYLGAGAGLGFFNAQFDEIDSVKIDADEDETAFAWQLMAGLAYYFTPSLAGTVGYTYFSAVDPQFDDLEIDYDSHNAMIGLRYSF